jgi:hypothetical protein
MKRAAAHVVEHGGDELWLGMAGNMTRAVHPGQTRKAPDRTESRRCACGRWPKAGQRGR